MVLTKFHTIPTRELIDMLDKGLVADEDLKDYAKELIRRIELERPYL